MSGHAPPIPDDVKNASLALSGRLAAPPNKYRVVLVDTFEGPFSDTLIGDFNDRDEAIAEAEARAGVMCPVYVYNSEGDLVFSAGKR